jgi:hypothetical protein
LADLEDFCLTDFVAFVPLTGAAVPGVDGFSFQ